MVSFLTSSLSILCDTAAGTYSLNPANNFVTELHRCLPNKKIAGLFVASFPDNFRKSEYYGYGICDEFQRAGFSFDTYTILDRRNGEHSRELVQNSDLIILSGGHVPTQNAFFADIHLKDCLEDFHGVLVGLSAGSMNSAEIVYAHPELDGEAVSPEYRRFLSGLGITKVMILPHYQDIKDDVLDGLRIFEDIVYPDSIGRKFYAIPDGTYLYCENGREELRGEAYLIENGEIRKINENNQAILLRNLNCEVAK